MVQNLKNKKLAMNKNKNSKFCSITYGANEFLILRSSNGEVTVFFEKVVWVQGKLVWTLRVASGFFMYEKVAKISSLAVWCRGARLLSQSTGGGDHRNVSHHCIIWNMAMGPLPFRS